MKNKTRPLYILIFVLTVTSLVFRIISERGFEQSSLLFIGLPATIAVLMVKYWPKQKSLYAAVFKAITLFLAISGILFGEGMICILISSPIFYGIGLFIVFIYEQLKKNKRHHLYSFILLPLLILLSQPAKHWKESEIIRVQSEVILKNDIGIEAFNHNPTFDNELPFFFELGFPQPMHIKGNGLYKGAQREITFRSSTKGEGKLLLEINRIEGQKITFKAISDSTHIDHWLTWKEMHAEIKKNELGQTQIIWESAFVCDLHPNWYFKPLEKYSVDLMNRYLIACYFE
ncbi:MAG: hypothetical protein AAF487_00435 [Bacteroidota bacterium]